VAFARRRQFSTLSTLNAFAETGSVDEAREVFLQLEATVPPKKFRMLFNTMIKACAKAGNPAEAMHYHGLMLAAGVSPNLETFGKLIEAAAKADGAA